MSTALEDANKEVETILAAAVAENGKGVLQSGLDTDSDGHVSGYLMKKGEGEYTELRLSVSCKYTLQLFY